MVTFALYFILNCSYAVFNYMHVSVSAAALSWPGRGGKIGAMEGVYPPQQIVITEIDSTKYIHVRQNGSSVRVFRETSV